MGGTARVSSLHTLTICGGLLSGHRLYVSIPINPVLITTHALAKATLATTIASKHDSNAADNGVLRTSERHA